jgi:hypothetical protein
MEKQRAFHEVGTELPICYLDGPKAWKGERHYFDFDHSDAEQMWRINQLYAVTDAERARAVCAGLEQTGIAISLHAHLHTAAM